MPGEEDPSSSNSPPGLATRAPAASTLAPPLPSPEATQENDNRKAKKALRKIIENLSNEKTLGDLHLKHYHMATSQFKRRTSHLDLPRRVFELFDQVVKKCEFCNHQKRPCDSVSGEGP